MCVLPLIIERLHYTYYWICLNIKGHTPTFSALEEDRSTTKETLIMMLAALFFIIATCILSAANGFSPSQTRQVSSPICRTHHSVQHTSPVTKRTHLYSSPEDKQAEIEALEAKLRELKGETVVSNEILNNGDDEQLAEEEEPEWEILKTQSNDSVMLSERWKEADPSYNAVEGGMLKNVAIALGVVVFLGIFSQIPIGNEDLQKYQDYKGSASRIDLGDLNDVRGVQ